MPTSDELRKQIEAMTSGAPAPEVPPADPAPAPAPPAADPDPVPAPPAPPADPKPEPGVAYRKEDGTWQMDIDLGDGSGVQSFKGKTQDLLFRELGKAQTNATRKIKELNAARKEAAKTAPAEPPAPDYKPIQLTDEEKFLIGQEMQTDPTGAIAKLFKSTVGASPDEIREALLVTQQLRAQQKGQEEARAFIEAHPDYVDTVGNTKAIREFLTANNLPVSKQNLEIAYEELSAAGLLESKRTYTIPDIEAPSSRTERIARPPKATVGLTSRQVASADDEEEPVQNGPSVEDLLKIKDPNERRRIAEKLARQEIQRRQR